MRYRIVVWSAIAWIAVCLGPYLYALWFRVRQDEPDRSAIIAEALAEHDDIEPIRIAAE